MRDLVERHGGSIAVASEGRGRGAAFTVELPVAAAVDADEDIAELLSEALLGEGLQTAIANDGRDALARWRRFQPHAGVLDVGLPDLDGYEVARAIRAEHGTDAALIAMTGYGLPTDRSRSKDAGFDCHMVKPVSVEDTVRLLDERFGATKP